VGPKRHILFEIENKVINFSEFVNPYSEFEQNWGLQIGPALFENGTFFCTSDNRRMLEVSCAKPRFLPRSKVGEEFGTDESCGNASKKELKFVV
jgi:hypothetical protein